MEQLQGSLCSSLQVYPNIIKDLKDQKLCSGHTRCTIQWSSFYQDAAGPNPGAGGSCNGCTSRQNIGRAATKYDFRSMEPSRYPHRETRDSPIQEPLSEKSRHCSTPAEHGHLLSSNFTPSYPNSNQDQNMYSKSGKKFDPNEYCSSHC